MLTLVPWAFAESGWLRGSDTANGGQRDASGLSFSFDVQACTALLMCLSRSVSAKGSPASGSRSVPRI